MLFYLQLHNELKEGKKKPWRQLTLFINLALGTAWQSKHQVGNTLIPQKEARRRWGELGVSWEIFLSDDGVAIIFHEGSLRKETLLFHPMSSRIYSGAAFPQSCVACTAAQVHLAARHEHARTA